VIDNLKINGLNRLVGLLLQIFRVLLTISE